MNTAAPGIAIRFWHTIVTHANLSLFSVVQICFRV